ncbi:hypothetical protein [Streptomyces griseus]|uniref:hypothetical protein n=1 Tax=Streptomyces griseus TaxID=1911 RepID=UPI0005615653|nr:hypothetical protein [Streptomyces griseus]
MLKKIEAVGSALLDRFVPRVEADASAQAGCYKCFHGSGCDYKNNGWWSYSANCKTNWTFLYCDDCV